MPAQISVQLYTLREETRRDFPGVLARLGRIGFAGVEPAGFGSLTPREFRRCVEDAGLVVSGAHVPLVPGKDTARLLDEQQEIANDTVVVPYAAPDRFATPDGVAAVADELNRTYESVRARGMRLGYHNHWWEFQNRAGERSAHEALYERLDPAIFAEIDTYWARVGGADPAEVLRRLGARAPLVHVKDGPADDFRSPHTAVGAGKLDWPAILAASPAVRWHVVELDRCATDMFEAVEQSYHWLTSRGLSRGRAA
jgi:sugar phosphate isomerase/epimerase